MFKSLLSECWLNIYIIVEWAIESFVTGPPAVELQVWEAVSLSFKITMKTFLFDKAYSQEI